MAGYARMTALFIAAAAVGGFMRFAAEYYLPPVGTSGFPRATLLVNITGTFVLGVVWLAPADVRLVVGTGLCGALTTFSGLALQLHRRITAAALGDAARYLILTIAGGAAACATGLVISGKLFT